MMMIKEEGEDNFPSLLPDWLNPKKSGDFRFFLIIVTAIIVALVGFTVGRNAWNSHQAAVAREQAAMAEQAREAERQVQLEQMRKEAEQQQAAKQQAEQRKEQYKNQLAQLSQLNTEVSGIRDNLRFSQNAVEYYCNERYSAESCDRNRYWLAKHQEELRQAIAEYNAIAAKVPADVLDYSRYALRYDENGNSVKQ